LTVGAYLQQQQQQQLFVAASRTSGSTIRPYAPTERAVAWRLRNTLK